MTRWQQIFGSAAAAVLMVGCHVSAHAADRIYLRTGTNLVCDHQKNFDGQVRLYLTPSEDNYLEVAASDIVREEPVASNPADSASVLARTANDPTQPAASSRLDLPALLSHAGAAHHLDPDLLASVVQEESRGQAHAISRAGAQGLMQLMPQTAADLGVRNAFAPQQNIAGGTTYLDALLMYYHDDLALALAAYNAGPAAVERYHGIPPYPETRRYVANVIHDYNRRKLHEVRKQEPSHSAASVLAGIVERP